MMIPQDKKRLIAFIILGSLTVLGCVIAYQIREAVLLSRLSPKEREIVGAWSWTYISGVGRILFTADHRVKEGFPPPDEKRPAIRDRDFEYLSSGTWRVEGDTLITETDNHLLLELLSRRTILDWVSYYIDSVPLPPRTTLKLETKIYHRKIVVLDEEKMVFEDGHSLRRVKR